MGTESRGNVGKNCTAVLITFLGRNNRIRRKKKRIWYDRKETDAPSCIDRRTADAVHKYGGRMQTAGKAGSNTRSIDGCGRQKYEEVNSASSSLEIEVELEDVLDHTRIRMDMDMENTVAPRAGHAKGRAEVKLNDNLVSSNMEIYQVEKAISM